MSGGSGIRLLVMTIVATVAVWTVLMLRPVLGMESEWSGDFGLLSQRSRTDSQGTVTPPLAV